MVTISDSMNFEILPSQLSKAPGDAENPCCRWDERTRDVSKLGKRSAIEILQYLKL